ncbi:MAG: hypothetical protein ACTSPI_03350 [Candidatus Heimdallarchaeaceae archaeon]
MATKELLQKVVTTLRDDTTFKSLTGSTWNGTSGDPRIYLEDPPEDIIATLDSKAAFCVTNLITAGELPYDGVRPDGLPDHFFSISIFSKTNSICYDVLDAINNLLDEKTLSTTSYTILWSRRGRLVPDKFDMTSGARIYCLHINYRFSWIVTR